MASQCVHLAIESVAAPSGDLLSESDLYVVFGSGSTALRTATDRDSNISSVRVPLVLPLALFPLAVSVYDEDGLRDDRMAQFRIDAPELGETEVSVLNDRGVCLRYTAKRVALADPLALERFSAIEATARAVAGTLQAALH